MAKLACLEIFVYMNSLVDFLKVMGWEKILGFRQDWNEAVIRQFYTTLEVRDEKEKLVWMFGTTKCKATFRELAATVMLRYEGMKRGKLVTQLPRLRADEVACFCYPKTSEYGRWGNLRRLPKVILEILRHTIVPTIGWDDSTLKWPSTKIVNVVLSGEPINLLDWMVHQMMECK